MREILPGYWVPVDADAAKPQAASKVARNPAFSARAQTSGDAGRNRGCGNCPGSEVDPRMDPAQIEQKLAEGLD
jgi:hypothetical protein